LNLQFKISKYGQKAGCREGGSDVYSDLGFILLDGRVPILTKYSDMKDMEILDSRFIKKRRGKNWREGSPGTQFYWRELARG